MHTGYLDSSGQMDILSKTTSRDHVTSTLFQTADRVNCAQNWYTRSYFPLSRRTPIREETLALISRLGSPAPVLSTLTSSKNGCSLSLATKGALNILFRCRSTSTGLMAFPLYSNNSQPGFANLKR